MRQIVLLFFASLSLVAYGADKLPVAPPPRVAAKKVTATVVSTLKTGQSQIRQFALDDDPNTYFESEKNASKNDHFTLQLDATVTVASIEVLTGKPDGSNALEKGVMEVSTDGKKFETAAKFEGGNATARLKNRVVKAIRMHPAEDLAHPLVVREIIIDSKPKVAVFKYPVEFVIDVSDAPEMKDWTEKCAQTCERNYTMICDELMSPGFKPLTVITMTMRNDYKGVAEAAGSRIKGSVSFFKSHPDDVGAMIHETAHCVQLYKGRGNPGWLVEGVADYVRFFKYELPGKVGRLNVEQAKYDGSYRITASFLNYVTMRYD